MQTKSKKLLKKNRFYRVFELDNVISVEFGYDSEREVTATFEFKTLKIKNKKAYLRKFNCFYDSFYLLNSIKDVLKAIEASEDLTPKELEQILQSLGFIKENDC